MDKQEFVVWKSPAGIALMHEGRRIAPPDGWIFVPSGDPGLTRRLKSAGDYWLVVHRRRNRVESVGLWTDAGRVDAVRAALEAERADPACRRKLEAGKRAREVKQAGYEDEFRRAVLAFLNFAPRWSVLGGRLADAVTAHAVPVGSGTVARTTRIPVERRAEAAVIAWMRHRTTAYDNMQIARIKGERREVRRRLAERSRTLLERYRAGADVAAECPLAKALEIV
ncbi:MAG: DUF2293 domain-containing protein [Lentisphaeria bacterium]|nr:DUF2293 domain-containing protein [Lentisphaeria bacterium]